MHLRACESTRRGRRWADAIAFDPSSLLWSGSSAEGPRVRLRAARLGTSKQPLDPYRCVKEGVHQLAGWTIENWDAVEGEDKIFGEATLLLWVGGWRPWQGGRGTGDRGQGVLVLALGRTAEHARRCQRLTSTFSVNLGAIEFGTHQHNAEVLVAASIAKPASRGERPRTLQRAIWPAARPTRGCVNYKDRQASYPDTRWPVSL